LSEAVKPGLPMPATGDAPPVLGKLRNISVGLMILDIKMPGKLGIEQFISLER